MNQILRYKQFVTDGILLDVHNISKGLEECLLSRMNFDQLVTMSVLQIAALASFPDVEVALQQKLAEGYQVTALTCEVIVHRREKLDVFVAKGYERLKISQTSEGESYSELSIVPSSYDQELILK